jgi:hypothetical protein
MSPEKRLLPPLGQGGFGLIAAMFVVVFLALFGVLAARFLATTSLSSSEDYLWTQALYSAESTAHRVILFNDGGGGGAIASPLVVQNVTTVFVNAFGGAGIPTTLEVEGNVPAMKIRRVIQVRYKL